MLSAYDQEGIFISATPFFVVSSEIPSHLVAFHDMQRVLRNYLLLFWEVLLLEWTYV